MPLRFPKFRMDYQSSSSHHLQSKCQTTVPPRRASQQRETLLVAGDLLLNPCLPEAHDTAHCPTKLPFRLHHKHHGPCRSKVNHNTRHPQTSPLLLVSKHSRVQPMILNGTISNLSSASKLTTRRVSRRIPCRTCSGLQQRPFRLRITSHLYMSAWTTGCSDGSINSRMRTNGLSGRWKNVGSRRSRSHITTT